MHLLSLLLLWIHAALAQDQWRLVHRDGSVESVWAAPRLLTLYGADLLRATLTEARERGTPTLALVEYLIEKRRRDQNRQIPLPVDLADRPELATLHVQPHALDGYDELAATDPEKNDDE